LAGHELYAGIFSQDAIATEPESCQAVAIAPTVVFERFAFAARNVRFRGAS
jgi:hypothetical protein